MAEGQAIKTRRVRIHVVHESRMIAEAINVRLKSLLPGAAVEGHTRSWEAYVARSEGHGGAADVVVIANELAYSVPMPARVSALVSDRVGVVVLGESTFGPVIQRAYDSGAHAYVVLGESSQSLALAVAAASRHQVYRSERVAGLVGATDIFVADLTMRELAVVSAYVSGAGASVIETANRFGLSSETVRTHLARVRRKYADFEGEAVSKLELRRRLIRDGWILG